MTVRRKNDQQLEEEQTDTLRRRSALPSIVVVDG